METPITVIQVLLGVLFIGGGLFKLTQPYAKFVQLPFQGWANDFKPGQIKLLGVLDVSGGVGLLVPLVLPSLAMLTPLAAVGIALYMAGAMATHLRRSEYLNMVGNLVVFLVPALFVAYGRLIGFAI